MAKELAHWKALIIDDSISNLALFKLRLAFYGAEVKTVSDCTATVYLLEYYTPTFILFDISMPRLNGWDTLKVIRNEDRLRGVPLIAVSAQDLKYDPDRVIEVGFDGYLAKPFHVAKLVPDLKHIIKSSSRPSKEKH